MKKFVYHRYQRNSSIEMVTACQASGKRAAEWCREHSIPRKTYSYHVRKLRLKGLLPAFKSTPPVEYAKEQVTFCEIDLRTVEVDARQPGLPLEEASAAPAGPAPLITVEYGRFRIAISEGAGRDLIQNVMEAIAHV